MKISQDGNNSIPASNGKISNGNSKERGNTDKDEEGEETGEKVIQGGMGEESKPFLIGLVKKVV